MTVPAVLVDNRNFAQTAPVLMTKIASAKFIGFDYETHDDRRHEGLNQRCGYDPVTRKKGGGKTKPLIFDFQRMDVCGASFYPENSDCSYYLNTGHADVENRLTYDQLKAVMSIRQPGSHWVAHNAQFEIAVTNAVLRMPLENVICTLQQCVSAWGPKQYNHGDWIRTGQGGIGAIVPQLIRHSLIGLTNPDTMEMSPELSDIAYKVIAKESDAEHSYNGLVNEISFGYGLKRIVASLFNYKMKTFEETLGDAAHMGQLTGEQVADYGADDAYWALRVFKHVLGYMAENGGASLINTFFAQENPMTQVYADLNLGGLKIDVDAVQKRKAVERQNCATFHRELRAAVRKLLPFKTEPNENLIKLEKDWYARNYMKYRKLITDWALLPDSADDYVELSRVAGAVSNKWREENGERKSAGPNFSHYMPIRTLLYDLIGTKPIIAQGKVEGDGEARGKLIVRLKEGPGVEIINAINSLASIEQRIKLYITPYLQLADPETNLVHPTVTSQLATRRMAASNPNGMQLAKRGESVFVRGYFKPDHEDHVIVSIDWSGIELVEIGEFSGDPEFIKAFGQLPHDDLHTGSAVQILNVEVPGLDTQMFKALRQHDSWDSWIDEVGLPANQIKRLQLNLKGEPLLPKKGYGYWRTEIGKGANFNYWYSGWLATIGERMGWGPEKTANATDLYRARFPVAENWRVSLIEQVRRDGFITLPDGHRYTRYEATPMWFEEWCNKFIHDGDHNSDLANYHKVIRWLGNKLSKRAGNQTVNAYIQGTCATIAKRSILRQNAAFLTKGWSRRECRFMNPIHDELVFSVHRNIVPEFIGVARGIMIDHPDLFKLCKLDASPSVGLTFEPWHSEKARLGQVEIYEPDEAVVGRERAGKRLDDAGVAEVVDWLFAEAKRWAQ
jgi:DNA polymerase I-like protein with 3'-5' exonuclease and polymerase domains